MDPHNHGLWTVIGVYRGIERNILHRRSETGLDDVGTLELGAGEVAVLDDDVIHTVVNPVEELTAALHVFGGDLRQQRRSEWDIATRQERPYDEDRVQQRFERANATASARRH
jgi:predicted metal-dependent enzyme (double-stranded beta helix superfamily)